MAVAGGSSKSERGLLVTHSVASIVDYWRTLSALGRFKTKKMRTIAFALSGTRVSTLESRVDSIVNTLSTLDHIQYQECEYDPILRRLISERLKSVRIEGSKQTLRDEKRLMEPRTKRWPGPREMVRRLGVMKTSLNYLSVLGNVEPPFDISPQAEIRTPNQVSLGLGSVIRARVILNGRSQSKKFGIECGPDFYVKEGAYVDSYAGYIKIGRGAAIAQGCAIHGNGGVEIGDYLMMGRDAMILAGNHHHLLKSGTPFLMQGTSGKGIHIGNNVWLGARAIILDGNNIGDNVVVGAGAIITKNIDSGKLVTGGRDLDLQELE